MPPTDCPPPPAVAASPSATGGTFAARADARRAAAAAQRRGAWRSWLRLVVYGAVLGAMVGALIGLFFHARPAAAQSPPRALLLAPVFPPGSEAAEIAALQRAGDHAAAIARAETALAKNPRDAQVRFLRAVSLTEARREADAVAAFEAMTQEFPELPEPYNNLAVLRAAQSRFDDARALLLRAIDVQPNYVTAIENLGDLYFALAAATYERALTLEPASAPLQAKLRLAREVAGRAQAAR